MKLSYDAINYVLWVALWNFHESHSDHFELCALFIITTHLRPFFELRYMYMLLCKYFRLEGKRGQKVSPCMILDPFVCSNGLVQDYPNFIVNALELPQACTELSICIIALHGTISWCIHFLWDWNVDCLHPCSKNVPKLPTNNEQVDPISFI